MDSRSRLYSPWRTYAVSGCSCLSGHDLDLWPLTSETFSAVLTYMMTICGKFIEIPPLSKEIVSHKIDVSGWMDGQMDGWMDGCTNGQSDDLKTYPVMPALPVFGGGIIIWSLHRNIALKNYAYCCEESA